MPGDGRSAVYAEVRELENWLKSADTSDVLPELVLSPTAVLPETRRRPMPLMFVALFTLFIAALLAGLWFWQLPRPVPPAARNLYFSGTQAWQTRTPSSLNAALDDFNRAIVIAPRYAEAYAGLANAYNLMPEYTSMPSSSAYPKAETAAKQAIRLNPRLGPAHAALAFAQFNGAGEISAAIHEYEIALSLDPGDANAEHWFATTLLTVGDQKRALEHINRASALDPDCLSIQADRGVILSQSDPTQAVGILKALEASHPNFLSPHTYLYQVYSRLGDDEGAVRELELAARLRGNVEDIALAQAASEGLHKGGAPAMLQNMLALREDQFLHGRADAYDVAQLFARLGKPNEALAFLKIAFDRHEAKTFGIKIDNAFDGLRGRPDYDGLAKQAPTV